MISRLLRASVPAWTLFYAVIGIYFAALFASYLAYDHLVGAKRFGRLGERAVEGARGLEAARMIFSGRDSFAATVRADVDGLSGWRFADGPRPKGYTLLSRFDGDARQSVAELVDLETGQTVFRWPIDEAKLYPAEDAGLLGNLWQDTGTFFRAFHPIAEPNGDLILKGYFTPLVRMNPCGDPVWRVPGSFHHSTERDADGNYWVPGRNAQNSFGPEAEFEDHTLTKISPDGEVLFRRSVSRILVDNDMTSLVFTISDGFHDGDPVHLNDIQPLRRDGPYWKKGDLLISARSPSLVFLYRPSTNEVLWHRQVPWLSQHDVDAISDTEIAVFSNNSINLGNGIRVAENNEVMVYDFETDTVTSPLGRPMSEHRIATPKQGLMDVTPRGFTLVEETEAGRVMILRPDGTVAAEYVNRAETGTVYLMAWSRYIDRTTGEALVRALEEVTCDGA